MWSDPFSLADWAYPPRNSDGIRPPPLTKMTNALNRNDVIMVQRLDDVPDRLARMMRQKGSIPDYDDNVWALGQIPQVQGALMALDPHTGRVLAMTGGYNPAMSEFNRVTQAQRQPGSAFKPFVYLAALDNGFSPTTRILDAPLVIDQALACRNGSLPTTPVSSMAPASCGRALSNHVLMTRSARPSRCPLVRQ